MNKCILFVLSVSLFMSCSKKDLVTPETSNPADFFYQDSNVGVLDLEAKQSSSSLITVNFKTSYEKGITKIELMSSGDKSNFCAIQVIYTSQNSTNAKTYSFDDDKIKGNPMYYMLRFTYSNGDWGYTPYYSIQLN